MFYYYYSGSTHIAIVAELLWHDDGRVKDIRIIEATYSTKALKTQYVRNTIVLSGYGDDADHYHIVRLK